MVLLIRFCALGFSILQPLSPLSSFELLRLSLGLEHLAFVFIDFLHIQPGNGDTHDSTGVATGGSLALNSIM